MIYCPCCSGRLLAHVRSSQVYWFCRNCWQEMPVFGGEKCNLLPASLTEQLFEEPQNQENSRIKTRNKEWMTIQEIPT